MDEILSLHRELHAVQMQSSANRFTEFNAVELLTKLIGRHLYQQENEKTNGPEVAVYYGSSGKEFVTSTKLAAEIIDELIRNNGIISFFELEMNLQISKQFVEKTVDYLIKTPDYLQSILNERSKLSQFDKDPHSLDTSAFKIINLNGTLMTNAYLDSICKEVNSQLKSKGQIEIGQYAQQYGLPYTFLYAELESRLNKIVFGTLTTTHIYTDLFVQLHYARVRGILRAITQPTMIRNLTSSHDLLEQLMYVQAENLVESGEVNGELTGAKERGLFIPAVYWKAQENAVKEKFSHDGYIEYSFCEQFNIANPVSFLSKYCPDGIPLQTAYLSQSSFNFVVDSIEDTNRSGGWLSIEANLPAALHKDDIKEVCKSAMDQFNRNQKNEEMLVLNDLFPVSTRLIERVAQSTTALIENLAADTVDDFVKKQHQQLSISNSHSATNAAVNDDDEKSKGRQSPDLRKKDDGNKSKRDSSKVKKGSKRAAQESSDSDEAGDSGKGKRKSKATKPTTIIITPASGGSTKKSSKLPTISTSLNNAAVQQLIRRNWPTIHLENGEVLEKPPPELILAMSTHLYPKFAKLYKDIIGTAMNTHPPSEPVPTLLRQPNRREIHEKVREFSQQTYDHIIVFSNAIKTLPSSASTNVDVPKLQSVLTTHLLKTLCTVISDILLRYEAWTENIRLKSDDNSGEFHFESLQQPLVVSDREVILASLAKEKAPHFKKIHAALSTTPVTSALQSCIGSLSELTEVLGIRLIPVDNNKKEKNIICALKKSLQSQLAQISKLSIAFHLTTLLLYAQKHNFILHAPSRCIHQIFELLQPSLSSDILLQLREVQSFLALQQFQNLSNPGVVATGDVNNPQNIDGNNNDNELQLLQQLQALSLSDFK